MTTLRIGPTTLTRGQSGRPRASRNADGDVIDRCAPYPPETRRCRGRVRPCRTRGSQGDERRRRPRGQPRPTLARARPPYQPSRMARLPLPRQRQGRGRRSRTHDCWLGARLVARLGARSGVTCSRGPRQRLRRHPRPLQPGSLRGWLSMRPLTRITDSPRPCVEGPARRPGKNPRHRAPAWWRSVPRRQSRQLKSRHGASSYIVRRPPLTRQRRPSTTPWRFAGRTSRSSPDCFMRASPRRWKSSSRPAARRLLHPRATPIGQWRARP